jgi:branched-chain amino acid transport system ATP-binding protein
MLAVNNVEVVYSDVILVLRSISLAVQPGQIVALLGANGAGKTTTLKSISGLLLRENGAVTRGAIEFEGRRLDKMKAEDVTRLGIVQVLEGRRLFRHLTAEENLRTGALAGSGRNGRGIASTLRRGETKELLEQVYEFFPLLRGLRHRTAGYLSGGEQQMIAIGRALMARPRLMLLDEPSLGLAPLLVQSIFDVIKRINGESGVSLLIVEQNASVALQVADYAYVMENGRIVLDGPAEQLMQNADIREFYLGLTQVGERKSYRDVKHYKRRKRWLG